MMATPYIEIYDMFLKSISSAKFANLLSPEELEDNLKDYLFDASDRHFIECRKDLSDRDDEKFNVELSGLEKRILVLGMQYSWFNSNHLANEEILSSRLLTRDYHIYSPANQIKVLLDLKKELDAKLRREIIKYEYHHWINE